jgi:hypothetical protein
MSMHELNLIGFDNESRSSVITPRRSPNIINTRNRARYNENLGLEVRDLVQRFENQLGYSPDLNPPSLE